MTSDRGARQDSETVNTLACPKCGQPLLPYWARSTLVFYCGTGHEITTEEVVGAETKSLNSGIQSVLQNWETRLQKLRQTVAEAQTRGHHEVAEVFQRHIANMESRIQILREAFLQAGGGPL